MPYSQRLACVMALHRTDRWTAKRRSRLAIIECARPATSIEGTGGVDDVTEPTRRPGGAPQRPLLADRHLESARNRLPGTHGRLWWETGMVVPCSRIESRAVRPAESTPTFRFESIWVHRA